MPYQKKQIKKVESGGALTTLVVLAFCCANLYVVDQAALAREMLLRLMNGFGLFCLVVGNNGSHSGVGIQNSVSRRGGADGDRPFSSGAPDRRDPSDD